jgi:hypothetical protein
MPPLSLGTSAAHSQSIRADHASAALFPYAQPRAAAAAGARVGSPMRNSPSSRAAEDRGSEGNLPGRCALAKEIRDAERCQRVETFLPRALAITVGRSETRLRCRMIPVVKRPTPTPPAACPHEARQPRSRKELTSLSVVAPGRPRMSAGRRRPMPRGLQPAARTPPPTRPHRRRRLPRPAPRSDRSGYR